MNMITKPADVQGEDDNVEKGEMTFLEHLEEFRWRIIKSVIGIVLGAIVVAFFINWIMDNALLLPATRTNPPLKLQNIRPFGQFTLYMEVILVGGIIASIPNIIYQFWKFIEPALKPGESRYIRSIVIFSSLCFLT